MKIGAMVKAFNDHKKKFEQATIVSLKETPKSHYEDLEFMYHRLDWTNATVQFEDGTFSNNHYLWTLQK